MNSMGRIFRVSIYGESHGPGVGIIIDGCPPGITLDQEMLLGDLQRRKPGATGTTSRTEPDQPVFNAGIFKGVTTGAPIQIHFANTNTRSSDYDKLREIPRPGHADFTASQKYFGYEDYRGGGHFSGRLTTCLVAAGSIAKMTLKKRWGLGFVIEATLLEAGGNKDVEAALRQALEHGDSIGGILSLIHI